MTCLRKACGGQDFGNVCKRGGRMLWEWVTDCTGKWLLPGLPVGTSLDTCLREQDNLAIHIAVGMLAAARDTATISKL